MKKMKVYEKPQICVEKFELSTHIAACKIEVLSGDSKTCYGIGKIEGFGDVQIFNSGVDGCYMEDDNACLYTHEVSSVSFNS